MKRVLYIVHNHPDLGPGGSEAYTMELYRALRGSGDFEPLVVARSTRAAAGTPDAHADAPFAQIGDDPNQLLFFVEEDQYDKLFMRGNDKELFTKHFRYLLESFRPDVVHIQQLLLIGTDLISAIRAVCPDTPIVYTLHEFVPICNHYGQMVRTKGRELCSEASPRRCHECYPDIAPQTFFLRKRFIQSQFDQVDLFIAPSRFLLKRYVDWGIPRERIRLEQHGFAPATPVPTAADPGRPRNRFAFFGVMTPFKGVNVLLRAMELLGHSFDGHLSVYGANYEHQPGDIGAELDQLFEATSATVTYAGPYDHDADLPRLLAAHDWVVVPSVWWENSPLVIREAFQHGRPVICSDIGGMAEAVEHGVSGLHFTIGAPASLADTLRTAATTPGLWEQLHSGIPPVRTMDDHVASLAGIYESLIAQRSRLSRDAARVPTAAS